MAQWVTCLLDKSEVLNSDPRTHIKLNYYPSTEVGGVIKDNRVLAVPKAARMIWEASGWVRDTVSKSMVEKRLRRHPRVKV